MKKIIKKKTNQILPASNGTVSEMNIKFAKEVFAMELIKDIIPFIKVDREYPTDSTQNFVFSINVSIENVFDLSKVTK